MSKRILQIAILLVASSSFANTIPVESVSPSVRKFIESNGDDISNYTPSCSRFYECQEMNYHRRSYHFKGSAQNAFNYLVSMKPSDVWKGTSRFELEYDPETNSFLSKNETLPKFAKGQIFFLELSLINGVNIPVAFKVVQLDPYLRTISFSYLKQNKSQGIQRINFIQKDDSFEIVHETYFKSSSKFRDDYLYRFFHERLVDNVWTDFANDETKFDF